MDNTETLDIGEEKEVKKKTKRYKLIRENELVDLNQILNTPFGKRFLWRLLERCHIFHSISHREPIDMSRVSGERDIGIWLIEEINAADKQGYIKLITDATQREIND